MFPKANICYFDKCVTAYYQRRRHIFYRKAGIDLNDSYYTARGYQKLSKSQGGLTPSLEDYMEMIYRIILKKGYIKGNELAAELHVRQSSVSKTLTKLSELGYLKYEKYGVIQLTESGERLGGYLLKRHKVLAEFFSLLNSDSKQAFMEAEEAEHILSPESVNRLEKLTLFLKDMDYGAKNTAPR